MAIARGHLVMIATAAALSVAGLVAPVASAGAAAPAATGAWGQAFKVPGLAALQSPSQATLYSISCASGGDCAAVGLYDDAAGQGNGTGYIVSEHKGSWGKAINIPGLGPDGGAARTRGAPAARALAGQRVPAGLDPLTAAASTVRGIGSGRLASIPSGASQLYTVSCGAPGECAAGGYLINSRQGAQTLMVSERHGIWRNAVEVASQLNADSIARVWTVSCPSAGNCTAGGYYQGDHSSWHAFVVDQRHGTWGQATPVTGTASPSQQGLPPEIQGAAVDSVSCASAGNCTAGGFDTTASGAIQAIVLTEQGGHTDASQHYQAFVADQRHGRWSKATEVPGTSRLNRGGNAAINSVSCPTKGLCSAAGFYFASRVAHPFLV